MRKYLPALAVAFAALFGCVPSPSERDGRRVIGVSVLTLTNPFFKVIADTITEEAAKHGYDVIVTSGEFDVARQQNQVKDFIVKKVAAIVLCPCDSRSIGPAIERGQRGRHPRLHGRHRLPRPGRQGRLARRHRQLRRRQAGGARP